MPKAEILLLPEPGVACRGLKRIDSLADLPTLSTPNTATFRDQPIPK